MDPIVLCIDDEQAIRKMLVEDLEEAGYKTIEASNGIEGLEAIISHKPNLILCDVSMPAMDGNELLLKLRAEYPEFDSIPFLLLTNRMQSSDIIEGKLLGADDYLSKPVDFDLLRATIDSRLMISSRLERKKQSELEDLRQSILGVLPHELRTPLNHILGFATMMKDETFGPIENEVYKEYVGHIQKGGEQLLKIINNILYLTDALSGNLTYEKEYFSASDCIESCVFGMAAKADEEGISLSTEYPEDLPELYSCEETLEQVLSALLSNAVIYSQENGSVRIRAEVQKNSSFVISVIDDGIGIANDDIPKVLKAFGRVENSMTRSTEGPGIGLTLAKGLSELLGAKFDLQSQIDKGTEVTIRFPLLARPTNQPS